MKRIFSGLFFFLIILLIYPAAESPQLPLGVEGFLPIAGCRVLERSLRLLLEGLHICMENESIFCYTFYRFTNYRFLKKEV